MFGPNLNDQQQFTAIFENLRSRSLTIGQPWMKLDVFDNRNFWRIGWKLWVSKRYWVL